MVIAHLRLKVVKTILLTFAGMLGLVAQASESTIEEIIVTGTHIKGADIEGALPVTVLDAEDIQDTGSLTGEDLLRSIPQLGSIGFGASRGGITGRRRLGCRSWPDTG